MNGIELIQQEREKQITKHGYTPEHDSGYKHNELLVAALAYINAAIYGEHAGSEVWPFAVEYFHGGTNFVEDLTKAGAFIAAELDRLQLINEENDK